MHSSIFVFSSVGSDLSKDDKIKIFKSWELDQYESGCVVYNNNFLYNEYFQKILIKPGFKFPNYFYFDKIYDITKNYEYISILDDDLLFKQSNTIKEAVNIMQITDIGLCSLANNNEGKRASYPIMYADHDSSNLKITNFCEMGCMIFKNTFLEIVKQEYLKKFNKLKDWGFDLFICSLAEKYNYNIGIVEYLSFSNPKQSERYLGTNEWILYKNKIKFISPIKYGNINVKHKTTTI